jgi:hypothetical protein
MIDTACVGNGVIADIKKNAGHIMQMQKMGEVVHKVAHRLGLGGKDNSYFSTLG